MPRLDLRSLPSNKKEYAEPQMDRLDNEIEPLADTRIVVAKGNGVSATQTEDQDDVAKPEDEYPLSSLSHTSLEERVRELEASQRELQAKLDAATEELAKHRNQPEEVSLREELDKARREVERLRSHLLEAEEATFAEHEELEQKIRALESELAQYKSREESVSSIIAEFEKLKQEHKEKLKECEQMALALHNLELVLEQFQAERKALTDSEVAALRAELTTTKRALQHAEADLESHKKQLARLREAEEACTRLQAELVDKSKAVVKLQEEVEPLRRALDQSYKRLSNALANEQQQVDRTLMKNLFIAYVEKKSNRNDVLALMSNVLRFTEEEKIKVGLAPSRSGSWIPFFGGSGSAATTTPAEAAAHKGLTDLWVEFLLKEADEDEPHVPR